TFQVIVFYLVWRSPDLAKQFGLWIIETDIVRQLSLPAKRIHIAVAVKLDCTENSIVFSKALGCIGYGKIKCEPIAKAEIHLSFLRNLLCNRLNTFWRKNPAKVRRNPRLTKQADHVIKPGQLRKILSPSRPRC